MPHKIAVVTPYHRESDDVLRQCRDSVLGQTYPCDHIVVADGHPNPMFDGDGRIQHAILPRAHGDNGNTPRGVGSLLADTGGYDAVAYLDADNWFAPDHLAGLVATHERFNTPIVGCKRALHTLDGAPIALTEDDEEAGRHVDTSCFLIFRPAFRVFRAWSMPRELAPLCDRVFFQAILHERFSISLLDRRSVAFRTQYATHYRHAGLPVPAGAKAGEDAAAAHAYLNDRANVNAIVERIGFYPVL